MREKIKIFQIVVQMCLIFVDHFLIFVDVSPVYLDINSVIGKKNKKKWNLQKSSLDLKTICLSLYYGSQVMINFCDVLLNRSPYLTVF